MASIMVLGAETQPSTKFQGKDLSGLYTGYNYSYQYPDGLDLTPGSKQHNLLRDYIMERAYDSARHIKPRHEAWASLDNKLTAYIPLDDRERAIKAKDKRRPVSIVLPVSYATLETFLTYLTAAFLDDFLFKYEGIGPEDVVGAMKIQHLINHQFIAGSMGLNLHTMWRDALVYNYGGIAVDWDVRTRASRDRELGSALDGIREAGFDISPELELQEKIVYEGNILHNMDPYYVLPYPYKPVYAVEQAEFTGWIRQTNYTELLRQEITTGNYFNVRYLARFDGRSGLSLVNTGRTDKTQLPDRGEQVSYGTMAPVDVVDMYIDIVPSMIGLGSSDRPERWVVSVAGDNIVVQAQPLSLIHNKPPLVVCSPTSDGHSMLDISVIEIGEGMADFFTFLINSKMANVRSALNLGLIYDPKIINMDDVSTSDPGFRARVNHSAWGLGILDKAIKQLDIKDITAGHIGDAFAMLDMNNRFLGTVDALQGVVRRGGERVTAEEISSTFRSALSRLEKMARIISMQAHEPLAGLLAYNTQELMSEDTYVKLMGDYANELEQEYGIQPENGRIGITAKDIDVDFNVLPHDGSTPFGGINSREWVDLLINFMAKTPVGSRIDFDKLFLRTARRLGEKNAHSLLKRINEVPTVSPEVQEDQQVEAQAQAGNLITLDEARQNGLL